MGLSIGIVGLPNVGKSTTFNALTKTQNAEAQNYPFCTIEPNKAIVPVPDLRLNELAKIVNPERIQFATVEFVDIAGLVKGASKGEGLGNQFLANIRETEVILHIVRCFEDENITHVEGSVDPVRDIEIIELELLFADIQTLEKRIARLQKQAKYDKKMRAELEVAEKLLAHLNQNLPVRTFPEKNTPQFENLNTTLRFLSNKDVIYGANVDEENLESENEFVESVKKYAEKVGAEIVVLCAKVEEELVGLNSEEQKEYLESLGVEESSLNIIIRKCFYKLNLITYFTAGVKEVRAWTIEKGWKAPKAASVIHNDFEKGFIRAEVISYNDFIKYEGEQKAKENGAMRLEGKDYIVQDGDVVHFRFNV
jgi:GTP-binding protein YchF